MKSLKLYRPFEMHRMHQLEGLPLALFRQRALAFIIDWVIVFIVFLIVLATISVIFWYRNTHGTFSTYTFHFPLESWYSKLIVDILIPVLYFGLLTYFSNGQTIGKRILRIRVVSLVHERMSFWHSTERALGYAAACLELGSGFFQYFFHPNCQTVQDRIAQTIVIDESKRSKLAGVSHRRPGRFTCPEHGQPTEAAGGAPGTSAEQ